VIDALEDAEDYAAFEMSVTADYEAQSAVERELVCLWRLRRAAAIESGLFKIQVRHQLQFRMLIKSGRTLSIAYRQVPCRSPGQQGTPYPRPSGVSRSQEHPVHHASWRQIGSRIFAGTNPPAAMDATARQP
jgi:hypothetical protein